MREYETVFILDPTLTDEQSQETINEFKKVAEDKGAEVVKVDDWGRRRLAFSVKKYNEGQYVIFTLHDESIDAVSELERRFKVSDSVIRFLSIRVDQERKRAEGRKKTKKGSKTDPVASDTSEALPVEESQDAQT